MVLVDGGILGNVPVQAAYEFNPDIIIAVDCTSPLFAPEQLNNPVNIADQVVSILMKKQSELAPKGDIVIKPDLGDYSYLDFAKPDSLIKAGEEAAQKQIPNIKNLIAQKKDSIFNVKILQPYSRLSA
jgi:NTE family protein